MRSRLKLFLFLGLAGLVLLAIRPVFAEEMLSFLPEQNEFKTEFISSPDAFIQFHISDYRYTSQLRAEILIVTRNKEAILQSPYSQWIVIKDKESANVFIPVFAHTAQFDWQWKEIKFKKIQEVPFPFIISDLKFTAEIKSPTVAEPVPLSYQDFEAPAFGLKKIQKFGNEKNRDDEITFIRNGRGQALKIKSTEDALYFVPFVKPLSCGEKPVQVSYWSKSKKFEISLASQEILEALQTGKKNKIDFNKQIYEETWQKQTLECVNQKNILGLFIELPKNSELMIDQIIATAPTAEF
jgi:hypothetical protein